jgi:hypothetical protein
METSHKYFYRAYLKEYHQVKAIYIKKLLSDIPTLNEEINNQEEYENFTKNTKFILQADLRQNYFHCIETFFEFFFAFMPVYGKAPENHKIVKQIVQSNWRKNYKKIDQIAVGKMKLNFLDNEIEIMGYKISIAHYIFYLGTFNLKKFDESFRIKVKSSTNALKKAIVELAKDFSKRDEYNAYKHTMRVFPSFNAIYFLDANTMEEKFKFDMSNSVSYQIYNDKDRETIVKTKLYDPVRDYQMTMLSGRMIYSMLSLREIVFNPKTDSENETIAIRFFSDEDFGKFSKHNVEIQDLAFSTSIVKTKAKAETKKE